MAASDARPIPIKNTAFRVTFPIFDADGDLVTGAASLDSETSADGGTFADCTNEATEIATSSGMYYLDLTAGEMNADTVAVIVKTGTAGAKTTPIVMYPEETGDINVDVTAFGGTAGTFASGRPEVNTSHISGDSVAADNAESFFDGTGYAGTNNVIPTVTSVTNTVSANTVQLSGDTVAADNAEAFFDGTGYAGTNNVIPTVTTVTNTVSANAVQISGDTTAADRLEAILDGCVTGTADSGSSTTVVDAERTEADTDYWKGSLVLFTSGNVAGQARLITAFDAGTDTITFAPAATQTVAAGITYIILPKGRVDLHLWLGSVANALISGRVDSNVQAMANDVITAAVLANDCIGATEIANGAIDSGAFAVGALDATALAANAAQEIADEILNRDIVGGASGGTRNVRSALRAIRNRTAIAAGTLTVYQEDDTTSAWTAALTTDAAANPIVDVNPT